MADGAVKFITDSSDAGSGVMAAPGGAVAGSPSSYGLWGSSRTQETGSFSKLHYIKKTNLRLDEALGTTQWPCPDPDKLH